MKNAPSHIALGLVTVVPRAAGDAAGRLTLAGPRGNSAALRGVVPGVWTWSAGRPTRAGAFMRYSLAR